MDVEPETVVLGVPVPRMRRWLILMPVSGFLLLSLSFIDRYLADAIYYPSCHGGFMHVVCGTERWAWLVGVVLWATLAIALLLYFIFESSSKRPPLERTLPAILLSAFLLAVLALGLAMIKVYNEAGVGRIPRETSEFIMFAFVTLGLWISGLTFAEHMQSKGFWPTMSQGLAIVVGGGAMAFTIAFITNLLFISIIFS